MASGRVPMIARIVLRSATPEPLHKDLPHVHFIPLGCGVARARVANTKAFGTTARGKPVLLSLSPPHRARRLVTAQALRSFVQVDQCTVTVPAAPTVHEHSRSSTPEKPNRARSEEQRWQQPHSV